MPHSRRNNKTIKKMKEPSTVGLVYAEWCGHCQAFKPEWEKFKENIQVNKKLSNKITTFEVEDGDVTKDEKIKSINSKIKGGELSVNGFPTIFKIYKGILEYYKGNRDASSLINWASSKQAIHNGGRKRKTMKRNNKNKM